MDLTIFLAQIWGPVIVAIGIGFLVSREHYVRVYRGLDSESLAVLVFAIVGMAAGLVQVGVHNTWSTLPEILVSLLGWGLLLKGAAFAIMPGLSDRLGDWMAATKLLPVAAAVMLVLGGYLSWVGYFA